MPLYCREFVDFLMAYLDEELPLDQRGIFEQHMIDCPPCEEYLGSYREAVRLGTEVCRGDDATPPEDAPDELVHAILAARKQS